MPHIETLEEFYKRKFDFIPEHIRKELGHFNVFRLDPFVGRNAAPVPYKRRDFYKIMLVEGAGTVHYADEVIRVNGLALSFSNPQIPYKWEHTDQIRAGYFCIFNQHFFHHFGKLGQYAVFQPGGTHIFPLTASQADSVRTIFERMMAEIASEYVHKYDLARNLVFELIHIGEKMHPPVFAKQKAGNASERISTLFLELLERQFPIDDNHPAITLRSASDFARQLNVHVNHLNRAVRDTTEKTTTQIIAERVVQEAKILLKHSQWNVSDIGYALGFSEVSHFNNFFKKHTGTSPLKFRNAQ